MGDRSETSDREAVARYYDRLAEVYGDGEFFGARRAAVLTAIADEIAGPRRVLDLGCGNGAFSVEFAARALRMLARLLLSAMRWRATGRTVQLAETVLVATKG